METIINTEVFGYAVRYYRYLYNDYSEYDFITDFVEEVFEWLLDAMTNDCSLAEAEEVINNLYNDYLESDNANGSWHYMIEKYMEAVKFLLEAGIR